MQSISYEQRKDLPNISAVYFIYAHETLLYIGSSIRIRERICNHSKKEYFTNLGANNISWQPCRPDELEQVEGDAVKKYRPLLNSYASRGLRKPKQCKHIKFNIGPSLLEETLKLLSNRSSVLTLPAISAETKIPLAWLKLFAANGIKDPSVNRVQALYEYLTGRKLVEGAK